MELGKEIVRQLKLPSERDTVLDRWMCHHLAEILLDIDRATGAEKFAAEQRAVDVILRIWHHRRALPDPVDPLSGLREAAAVLRRLVPGADPWERRRHLGNQEPLLRDMFRCMAQAILGGIAATTQVHLRALSESELAALDPDERRLVEGFAEWTLPPEPPGPPSIRITQQTADGEEGAVLFELLGEQAPAGVAESGQPESPSDTVIQQLEAFHGKLGTLIQRLKEEPLEQQASEAAPRRGRRGKVDGKAAGRK